MSPQAHPSEQDVERVVRTYGSLLFRVCFVVLRNRHDAEDAVQETYYRYVERSPSFNDGNHEKAWLITVASNQCRNMQRFRFKHSHLNLDDLEVASEDDMPDEVLQTIFKLPPKYHSVIHLHYVEGYSAKEIARILAITTPSVLKRLQRGRRFLKIELGGPI
jgi:RNA polymerase sigma factor (sigma-70 family)